MHIVALNQFYAPDDAPTGRHLADLARELVARGHRVTVVASRRSYAGDREYPREEVLDGVRVRRLAAPAHGRHREGRLVSWLGFYSSALAFLLTRRLRADLFLSMTTPPYLGLLAAMRGRAARTPVAHWVMDLYPDAFFAHGLVSPEGPMARLMRSLAHWSDRSASLVLTIGPFMHAAAGRHGVARTPRAWVPLWGSDATPSPAEVARVRRERGWSESDVVFLYSGNMGLGHRLEEFLALARAGQPPEVLWCFLGGGVRIGEVQAAARAAGGARIQLLPYVSASELGASLVAADVHLVSLRREWQGVVVPSKLQAAFCVGRPAVFVGPEESEPAEWIRLSRGGWRVGEGDVEGLLACVRDASVPAARAERAGRALAFAREHFSRERNCARIADLLERAAGGSPG